jgi:hypothetical protein
MSSSMASQRFEARISAMICAGLRISPRFITENRKAISPDLPGHFNPYLFLIYSNRTNGFGPEAKRAYPTVNNEGAYFSWKAVAVNQAISLTGGTILAP